MSCARVIALVVISATALAGCGQSARDPLLAIAVPHTETLQTRTVTGLGVVLVDAQGQTLYLFGPDARSRVSCTGACAGTWPPLVIARGQKPTAGAGVKAADLGTIVDPNTGASVVTYAGYPLYRYAGDIGPGTANGQGLFLDGGPWYALSPGGTPVTSVPASGP